MDPKGDAGTVHPVAEVLSRGRVRDKGVERAEEREGTSGKTPHEPSDAAKFPLTNHEFPEN